MENQTSSPVSSTEVTPQDRTVGMWMHFGPLLAYLFNFMVPVPLLSLIASLVLYFSHREKGGFVARNGKESLNFQITLALVWIIFFAIAALIMGRAFLSIFLNTYGGDEFDQGSVLSLAFSMLPLIGLSIAVWLVSVIFMVVASLRARDGKTYRYPLSIRFVS